MSLDDRDLFIDAIEFVLDAVSRETSDFNRTQIGWYLISLLVSAQQTKEGA
ncbi:hypothetical protein P4S72_27390 [Vibrio sp. PP-XX7]